MGSLLTYSGIAAKVKAMESRFITDAQFREMAMLESVPDALEYLKRLPSYEDIFANVESTQMHRADIEQLLYLSQYRDYAKLYRFSNPSQRKFLDLCFLHYEIAILKKCLRNTLDHRKLELDLDLSIFKDFFEQHSKLDLIKLSVTENMSDFIANLEGSPFYSLLNKLSDLDNPTLFDYEMHMDLLYFSTIWKVKDKYVPKSEQKILSKCFGSRLDMLNIQWIYRSKKYYQLEAADIYALLIPINYRLKKAEVNKLVETASMEEFFSVLQSTFYGRLHVADLAEQPNLEDVYEKVLNKIHSITSQKNPYSIAVLNSYLYFKELEIHKIITAIESIRYGVDPNDIIAYVIKN